MENRTGLVHEFKEARPALKQEIPSESHRHAVDAGSDVPAQKPAFEIPLHEVGICQKKAWVLLPQGRICFNAEITVNLSANLRGIHMSRMEEALTDLYYEPFSDLTHYAEALVTKILERQEGSRAAVRLEGDVPHLWKTCASGRISTDSARITAELHAERDNNIKISKNCISLKANHITACPCTQIYSEAIFGPSNSPAPMPTHSQRSSTMILAEDIKKTVSYGDLMECLNSALTLTQDLLKRPDEAEIVLKSHNRPQFAEDAVREVAAQFARSIAGRLDEDARVHIESISFESIHTHNVVCRIETTAGELRSLVTT